MFILVMGPPRSCTSVTARILHEKLGVCMGLNLVAGNEGNPFGFYEDYDYVKAIKADNVPNLVNALARCTSEKYGIKSPDLAFFDSDQLRPDLIIRTVRPILSLTDSLMRWYKPAPTATEALSLIEKYEKSIDIWCKKYPFYRIEYDGYRDDTDIAQELSKCLQKI